MGKYDNFRKYAQFREGAATPPERPMEPNPRGEVADAPGYNDGYQALTDEFKRFGSDVWGMAKNVPGDIVEIYDGLVAAWNNPKAAGAALLQGFNEAGKAPLALAAGVEGENPVADYLRNMVTNPEYRNQEFRENPLHSVLNMMPMAGPKGLKGMSALDAGMLEKASRGLDAAGQLLYTKAARPAKAFQNPQKAIDFGRNNRVMFSGNGALKNQDRVAELSGLVDDAIAQANGQTINLGRDLFPYLHRSQKKAMNRPFTKSDDLKTIRNKKQKMLDDHGEDWDLKKAQEVKKQTQHDLADDFGKDKDSITIDSEKDVAYGLRQLIEKHAPGVIPHNREMSPRIQLGNMMYDRLAGVDKQALIGLNDIVMAKMFGAPGFLARRFGASPYILSGAGIGATDLGKVAGRLSSVTGAQPVNLARLLSEYNSRTMQQREEK